MFSYCFLFRLVLAIRNQIPNIFLRNNIRLVLKSSAFLPSSSPHQYGEYSHPINLPVHLFILKFRRVNLSIFFTPGEERHIEDHFASLPLSRVQINRAHYPYPDTCVKSNRSLSRNNFFFYVGKLFAFRMYV